jgi:hypothetical protein
VLLSVFESWVNGLKRVVKHEGKYYIQERKTRDISSRLTEKTGEHELMDPYRIRMREQCGDATEGK